MEKKDYIRKQIQEHIAYIKSIQKCSAFSTEFYHPKTKRRITWSEKCTLVDRDLDKRVKRIECIFEKVYPTISESKNSKVIITSTPNELINQNKDKDEN